MAQLQSASITGSLTVTGQVVAQTLNVQQVTSSIVYSSGSNIFGNSLGNTQQFTGSLQVSGSSHNILGNVGIGPTGTPAAELQVGKSSDVAIAMSNSSSVTSGNRGSLAWYNSSNSTVANIKAVAITDNVGTELQFYTRPAAGSLTQVLTISSSGSVGIGTTSPTNILTIKNNTAATNGIDFQNYSTSGVLGQFIYNQADDTFSIINTSAYAAGGIVFRTSTTEKVRILTNGNVGIGTASPAKKLDVYESSTASVAQYIRNTTINGLLLISGTSEFQVGTETNHPFTIITNNQERLRVTANGLSFNGDTAAANALDDYEEGTWTPVPTSTGATFSTTVNGTYTKIGRLVYVLCTLDNNSSPTGTLTNEMSITGLPFTSSPGSGYGASLAIGFEVNIDYPTGGLGIQARISTSTTSISLRFTKDDASGDDFLASNFDQGDARIALAGCYEV